MFGLRAPELLLIFAVLLLLFGATKLPALGSSLGSAIRNFKKGFGGESEGPAEGEKRGTGSLPSTNQLESSQTPAAQRKDV
ncbi:MAG: twin-arginine translocase TatA/TatE family subunit [Myxococcaceae bacterium]|nr:twin-arginine translocase TatA/TatE family subunit [Myxococcaceae bacterium]MCI0673573.1 twin-arginine translocase TatA/TatE family subunit [Myxococcaceae bacterium]